MKRLLMVTCALLCAVGAHGRTEDEILKDICRTVASADLPPEDGIVPATNLEQLCAAELQELGVSTDVFWTKLEGLLTNTVTQIDVTTNAESAIIVSGALTVFSEYGSADASRILAYVMTNAITPSASGEASVLYACRTLQSGGLDFYVSPALAGFAPERKTELWGGLYAGFNKVGGDAALTNRMIGVALGVIGEQWGCWSLSDRNLCRWWPEYATSSNRYYAVDSALNANLPSVSRDHLEEILGQLLALPDGTMTLLPTNQYSTACQP
ncbi:MAG: hypothetical protein IJ829_02310 [Kiritimatiellae bacterium]|nr:hypothetical protein [Kiritimatiellia bacterium]